MESKAYIDFYRGQDAGYEVSAPTNNHGQENVARVFVGLVLGAFLLIAGVLWAVNKYESQVNAWLMKNNVQTDRRWLWGF